MADDPTSRDEAGDDRAPPGDEDEDRAAILARRRALVRRAIASIGAIVGGLAATDCAPTPCLDVAPPQDVVDAAPDATPSDGTSGSDSGGD